MTRGGAVTGPTHHGGTDEPAADARLVALIVPPRNTTVEAEMPRLLGAKANVVTTRFRSTASQLEARLTEYLEQLPGRLDDLAGTTPDVVVVGCTGCFYSLSPDDARAFERALADRWQVPVVVPVVAIADALDAAGIDRLTLVSPYPDALTERAIAYWRRGRATVAEVVRVGGGDPYDVTTDDLVGAVRAAPPAAREALLFTGTGIPTLGAMRRLAATRSTPMLSSNWCAAWRAASELAQAAAAHVRTSPTASRRPSPGDRDVS